MPPLQRQLRRQLPRVRRVARTVVQLQDAPWRWAAGAEAALAIGLVVGVFTLAGHQTTGLVAALGSFTALYGAGRPRPDRVRLLPLVAVGLVLAAALGVATAGSAWLTGAGLVVVSLLACGLTLGLGLGAPGPLMFVLVAAVSGHLGAPVRLGGVGLAGGPLIGLVAIGAALAYLVVLVLLALPAQRRAGGAATLRELFPQVGLSRAARAITWRVAAAVGLASALGPLLGAHRTYWVVLAAVAVLQGGASRQLTALRTVHRVGGSMAGVLLFEILLLTHPVGAWLVVLLMLLQGATEVVVARNYGLALCFITPLALLNATASHPAATLPAVQGRLLDTLLGAGVALVVFWAGEGLQALVVRRGQPSKRCPKRL